jgi:hypothetical protein
MLSLLWMQTYKIAGRDSGLIYDYHANFDLVSGWKKKRYDSVVAKTYLLNYLIGLRKTSGVQLNDFNLV